MEASTKNLVELLPEQVHELDEITSTESLSREEVLEAVVKVGLETLKSENFKIPHNNEEHI